MRILFITDNFPPEVNAPAIRTWEHSIEWVKLGADVTILTTQPNFPNGKIYNGYRKRLVQKELMDGIRVIRLYSYITKNSGVIRRIIDFLSMAMAASLYGLFLRFDVVIATSPQLFTTWAASFLSFWKKKPWIFELRDLWPDSILAVGAIQNQAIIKTLHRIEYRLYHSAEMIIPNTPAFRKYLLNLGLQEQKIHVIANGTNSDLFFPREKNPLLLKNLKLENKFVIGYIGTHGMAHSLDFIVESIAVADFKNIHFLFVGDGAEKERIKKLAEHVGAHNITFLDSVPREQIPEYLSITDASLVPLKKAETFKKVIPSKIFEACAMGKPIILGVDGQAKNIIDEYNAGVCFGPENGMEFINAVNSLKNDPELYRELSSNALNLAHAFDRKKLAREMLEVIRKTVGV